MIRIPAGMHPKQQVAFANHMRALRRALPECERGYVGYPEIVEYLRSIRVVNERGQRVTKWTVKRWYMRKGFPLFFTAQRNEVQTTNLAVTGWLLSLREYYRNKPRVIRPNSKLRNPELRHATPQA